MAEVAKKRGAADAAFKAAERETVTWTLTADAAAVSDLLRAEGVSA